MSAETLEAAALARLPAEIHPLLEAYAVCPLSAYAVYRLRGYVKTVEWILSHECR
jgi:hypothetical protein